MLFSDNNVSPKVLLDEMFDEYMNLFDYVIDEFKK